jgi:hypothetical protein
MARITPADLAEWRRQVAEDGGQDLLAPATAQALVPLLAAELELAWAERDRARLEALREAARLLDDRLASVGRQVGPGPGFACRHCRDAEARRFAATLHEALASQ